MKEKTVVIKTNEKFAKSFRKKCNRKIVVAGRATTKTSVFISMTILQAAMEMPRCHIALASVTFEKIYTSILPLLVQSWESWGLIQDLHFFIGKDNPKLPRCYYEPKDFSRTIKLWNGTTISLGSFNDAGFFNGKNIQFLVCDEVRFIKHQTFVDGISAAIRGARKQFEHSPLYLGMVLCTDRPKRSERWIMDFKKQMQVEKLKQIDEILDRLDYLESQKLDNEQIKKIDDKLNAEIVFLNLCVNHLRKSAIDFIEMSTIENVDMLGWEAIVNFYNSMDKQSFKRQILNLDSSTNEDLFYPSFDETKHTIDLSRPLHIQNLLQNFGFKNKDCRWTEMDTSAPLILTNDANTYFNCLIVGQLMNYKPNYVRGVKDKIQLRIIAYIYCSAPETIKTCAENFVHYFQYHENKTVYYAYDSTMSGNQEAVLPDSLKKELNPKNVIVKVLKQNGYSVSEFPMGLTKSYKYRFNLWEDIFKGNNVLSVFIDRNLSDLIEAFEKTERSESGSDLEKVKKRIEGNPNINQATAPHPTDACDLMMHFIINYINGIARSTSSYDLLMS